MLKFKVRFFVFRAARKVLFSILRVFDSSVSYEKCTRIIIQLISSIKSEYKYDLQGTKINYSINSVIGFLLFFKGSFEESELEVCRRLLKDDSIIFDIGANIGIHSSFFSGISVNGFVYSFEPSRETFGLLCRNLNKTSNTLPLNFGIGKKTELMEFYETTDNAYSSFKDTRRKPVKSLTKVLCYKLDDLVRLLNISRVDFIKIDVEGFEQEVVDGMSEVLTNLKPIVLCEIFKGVNSNLNPQLTFDSICKYSYSAFVIEGSQLVKCVKHSESYENYLFIPENRNII